MPHVRPRAHTRVISAVCIAAFLTHPCPAAGTAADAWPLPRWPTADPAEVGLDAAKLDEARDYALTGGGSGYITRQGKLVLAWGDPRARYDLKSTTKSIGATALGVALADGKLQLNDPVVRHHPAFGVPPESNRQTGWIERMTILHLATHTAGFEKPGGYTRLTFEPGTRWAYSDGGPNWLAECVTLAYRRDVQDLMFERVFTPLGITREDLVWRHHHYRPREIEGILRREFGSGVSANVDAMARIGYLYLRGGVWNGKRILPAEFVAQAAAPIKSFAGLPVANPQEYGKASDHYGLLWWNNADGTLMQVPRDAFWSWGLYDSLIVVIPSLDLVVARAGTSWKRKPDADHYDVLRPFLEPIVAAVRDAGPHGAATGQPHRGRSNVNGSPVRPALTGAGGPSDRSRAHPAADSAADAAGDGVPPSPLIQGIEWAPAVTIIRRAPGSDNWPLTWGDDDHLYTAYGDGRGFEPFVEKKLSLGLARIGGGPEGFSGSNLRAPDVEQVGDGARGKKASGILMVDGVLYLWVRNAENSQLARSADRGRTWTWSDWCFTRSFGCPTFLNFGRNYAGARDEYVYVYSHESDSAYQAADGMVLARVPRDRVFQRDAYQFFVEMQDERPLWTDDIDRRGFVFAAPGRCYRSSVSYNAPLKRYLWCQVFPGTDARFEGGFAVYDAPEPWGPWSRVFFTKKWDVGPGETASLPTKWISDDGLTVHLVFSGNDAFSVRKGTLLLRP